MNFIGPNHPAADVLRQHGDKLVGLLLEHLQQRTVTLPIAPLSEILATKTVAVRIDDRAGTVQLMLLTNAEACTLTETGAMPEDLT